MRRASNPAVSPQLYKQFATVTVVLTLAVAFFANSDNDQAAAASTVQPSAPRDQAALVAQPSFRMPAGETAEPSPWEGDDSTDFDQPVAAPSSSGSSLPPALAGISGVPGTANPETAVATVAGGPSATISQSAPTPAQIAAAEAASRLRSQASGSED